MQRIFVSGIPNTNAVISRRITCGACELIQTVYSPVRRVVVGGCAARLHRRGDQPLVDESLPDDDVGRCERRRRSPSASPHSQSMTMFAGAVLVDLRRAGCDRLLGVDDRVERLPVDLDQLERVLGLARGVSATTAATPAPVKVDLSISSARGVTTWFSVPAACQAHGSGFRCAKSLPVKTATTPGLPRHVRCRCSDPGVRIGRAQDRDVRDSCELEVVEVAARLR